jgi:hypothetical protein
MTFLKCLPIVLLAVGAVIIWISFTNEENITGLWVAGKDFRDAEFKDSERFRRRTYTIFKLAGILIFLAGIAVAVLT